MPDTAVAVTVAGAVRAGADELSRAGVDSPRLDAELLLAATLGVDRSRLVIDAPMELDGDDLRRFQLLLKRRAAREPVAYILGRREFRRISLGVDRRVLIPRPETELLVEVGLQLPPGARVVDIGTGAGAVALALKEERPDLRVWAVDADADALAVATANAARLGLAVEFVRGDLRAGLECDAVLANLPYVSDGADLAPEITLYEPARALYGGPDGLDVIRRLIGQLDGVALVALEVGFDQAGAVGSLLAAAGYGVVEPLRDLAGHERVVVGRHERVVVGGHERLVLGRR